MSASIDWPTDISHNNGSERFLEMILDRLDNAEKNCKYGPEIMLAFDYLRRTDFSQLATGRHELDGDRVYASVLRYRPKPMAEAAWEAHRRYLDVQFIVSGAERMGYAPLRDDMIVHREYNSEKDCVFYEAEGDFVTVRPGFFVLFGPQDVHSPCIALPGSDSADEVCKVVVKCRVS